MEAKIPDPANYTMKGNKPETREIPVLRALPDIDINDPKQVRKLLSEELWEIVRRNRGSLAAVPAINVLWDRAEGKPGQAITVDANVTQVTVNANVQFVPAKNQLIDAVPNLLIEQKK